MYIYRLIDKYGLIWEENRNKAAVQEAMVYGYGEEAVKEEGLHIVRATSAPARPASAE